MKKRILQLSCFLTGYNYMLLEKCSEDSTMAVKRYASGLWTILIMWLFIGYNFVNRYFKADIAVSITGALVLGCIILFLERFIILGHKQSRGIYYARVFIGCIMAFLGSMVLDQIIFKEDIAKQKQFLLGQESEKVYQSRSIELNKLIKSLSDSKSKDSVKLATEIVQFNANPVIFVKRAVTAKGTTTTKDLDATQHVTRTQESPTIRIKYVDSAITNPVQQDINFLTGHIQKTELLIQQHQNEQLSLKSNIEQELKQTTGFIDEQKALIAAVKESVIGWFAWALFFLFFASIELLIVMNKIAERKHMSDYETLIAHQKEMHEKKIKLLAEDENSKPKKMNQENENQYEGFFLELKKRGVQIDPNQKKRITEKITRILKYQPRVGIFGKSGVGKSSLCNALFGQDVCEISDIEACTREPQNVLLGIGGGGSGIILVDVPGLGESKKRDVEYKKLYRSLLPELDLILWILKADERAYSIDQDFYLEQVKPHLEQGKPFLIVLNQIDNVQPKEWDSNEKRPGPLQSINIQKKKEVVAEIFDYPLSKILEVSANEKYNLIQLVDEMIFALPNDKKITVLQAIEEEYISPVARERAAKGVVESALGDIGGGIASFFSEDWREPGTKAGEWVGRQVDKVFDWFSSW